MAVTQSEHIRRAIALRDQRPLAVKFLDWIRSRPEGGIAVLFFLVQLTCIVAALLWPDSFRYLSEALWAQGTMKSDTSSAYKWEDESTRGNYRWQDFNKEAQAQFIQDVFSGGFLSTPSANAAGPISAGIAPLLFATNDPATPVKLEQAKKIFADLQQGKIDRSLFTDNANGYFSEQALADFAAGLGPLGQPQSFTQTGQSLRGGMIGRSYLIRFPQKTIRAWTYEMPDGKLEQYQIAVVN